MTDDLISRADAIEAIEELPNAYNGWSDAYDKAYIIGTLEEVPSAQHTSKIVDAYTRGWTDGADAVKAMPQPKHGEWVNHEEPCVNGGYWHYVMCTACKEKAIIPTNFCPNCGADMREREGE